MGTILACSCAICKTLCRCPPWRTSYVGKFKECISFKPRLVLHLNCAQFICIVQSNWCHPFITTDLIAERFFCLL
jgi:hypothetical protein